MTAIHSFSDLQTKLAENDLTYLLLYKQGSETSDCAFENLNNFEIENVHVYTADVSSVRDIHTEYGITNVPVLLRFEKNVLGNQYKGCNQPDFYKSIFENVLAAASTQADKKTAQKQVTVYSTPTCSWCTRLKKYLKEKNIRYTDIDVSKNQTAAQEMVKKSGQQGVPQTTIAGTHIVGFDKARIDSLLGL